MSGIKKKTGKLNRCLHKFYLWGVYNVNSSRIAQLAFSCILNKDFQGSNSPLPIIELHKIKHHSSIQNSFICFDFKLPVTSESTNL